MTAAVGTTEFTGLIIPATPAKKAVKIPTPCGYHLVIALPPKTEKVGSLYKPQENADIDYRRSIVVEVVAMGVHAYQDKERYPYGPWCKVGDWIMIGTHVGSSSFKIPGDDREFRIIMEDQPMAVVEGPESVERV